MLVGRALGESIAEGPAEIRLIDFGHEIVGRRELGWLSFKDAFLAACQPNGENTGQWICALGQLPADLSEYVESIDRQLVSGLRREKLKAPADIWANHGYFIHIDTDLLVRLRLLSALSIPSLIQALEAVPSHILQRQILDYLHLHEDRDLLLSALKAAPAVYENESWTGRASLYLFVEEVVRHADGLSSAVERAGQMGAAGFAVSPGNRTPSPALLAELTDWLKLAFSTAIDRPEGFRVGVEYAAELVGRTLSGERSGPRRSWDSKELARDVLLEQLAATKLTGTQIKSMAPPSHQEAARRSPLETLIVLGCVDHSRRSSSQSCDVSGDPRFVWQLYEELLGSRDSGLAAHVNPYGMAGPWAFAALGSALLALPNPAEQWLATWSSLHRQREEARFCGPGDELLAPSIHLLRVACNASLVRKPDEVLDADRRLWDMAQLRASQLFLSGLLLKLPLEQIGPWTFFPVVPHVMGKSWEKAVHACEWIFNISDIAALLSANALVLNGVDPASVKSAFSGIGCDLIRLGERLERWIVDSGRDKKSYVHVSAIIAAFQGGKRDHSPPGSA
jgi:hypothetical protein